MTNDDATAIITTALRGIAPEADLATVDPHEPFQDELDLDSMDFLNLMVAIAERLKPHTVMLVPEGRQEVTTEGGLDVVGQAANMREVVERLHNAGLLVSAFIDADDRQIDACKLAGFDVCEVHTGPYAHAFSSEGGDFRKKPLSGELARVASAGERILGSGMRFNAGHALNYHNVQPIAALPGIEELHIGHAIVSRAIYTGMQAAVAEMKRLMTLAHQS